MEATQRHNPERSRRPPTIIVYWTKVERGTPVVYSEFILCDFECLLIIVVISDTDLS
jgi:hypothetical protein